MLTIFNPATRTPFLPLLISVSNNKILNKPIPSHNSEITVIAMPPSNSKLKIVAEYAKSNRSSCKKCSQVISAKALRLGSVTRDSRGFDMTKWHHLVCFSERIESIEAIGGFDSLQSCDQDALKKLVSNGENEAIEGSPKSGFKRSEENGEEVEQERDSKKTKFSTAIEEVQYEIAFSLAEIKDKYKDAKLLPKWKAFQTVIFLEQDDGLQDSNKIAAFDFDGCLAKTSVKKVGADAWSLMYPSIPNKLQNLYKDGYKLVIFTNESNIDRWKNKRQIAVDSKIGRLNNFIKLVKVPIQVFIACGYSDGKITKLEDPYRKPKPGMWHLMAKHMNSGISIDMEKSFYVGDAAGRINDHSDADLKFAQTIGLKFIVPEDYFGA